MAVGNGSRNTHAKPGLVAVGAHLDDGGVLGGTACSWCQPGAAGWVGMGMQLCLLGKLSQQVCAPTLGRASGGPLRILHGCFTMSTAAQTPCALLFTLGLVADQ